MPEYKCAFVKEDKETVIDESETKIIHADTARAAAAIYKLEAMDLKGKVLIGPIVRTCDENGQERFFPDTVSVGDKKLFTQKESQTTSTNTEKKEPQLSLPENNLLLWETAGKERSLEYIKRVRQDSCYSTLRKVIGFSKYLCLLVLGVFTLVFFINFLTIQEYVNAVGTIVCALVFLVLIIASDQSAKLIVDIADVLVDQGRNRKKS